MTALKEFVRLEAIGLWRAGKDAQRREVIVSLGKATLTISDINGAALAHWSLAAVCRRGDLETPVLYHPDGTRDETLELDDEAREIITAIERIMRAITRGRPRPGKLRLVLAVTTVLALGLAGIYWLPGAMERYALRVLPEVKRAEIGQSMLAHLAPMIGAPCDQVEARVPLARLARQVLPEGWQVVVVPQGRRDSLHLPGRIIVLHRRVLEDYEDPDVVLGFILAEHLRATKQDPLAGLVAHGGMNASLRLLTTGGLPQDMLAPYSSDLFSQEASTVSAQQLLSAFATAQLRSTAYARAADPAAQRLLSLIEQDPLAGKSSRSLLDDADWLRLQGICGG